MNDEQKVTTPLPVPTDETAASSGAPATIPDKPREFGGFKGPEPTRYGDWEQKGRCTDF